MTPASPFPPPFKEAWIVAFRNLGPDPSPVVGSRVSFLSFSSRVRILAWANFFWLSVPASATYGGETEDSLKERKGSDGLCRKMRRLALSWAKSSSLSVIVWVALRSLDFNCILRPARRDTHAALGPQGLATFSAEQLADKRGTVHNNEVGEVALPVWGPCGFSQGSGTEFGESANSAAFGFGAPCKCSKVEVEV